MLDAIANKGINPLEYDFLTHFAHSLFTHSDYSERHNEMTLTQFALSMRHLEHRVRQGDVFADKLWHDIANRLKLIQDKLDEASDALGDVTLLSDKHYLFAFELGAFKSPLSEMIFASLIDLDYFAARIMALYCNGKITKQEQFKRINHFRNQLRNLMRMCHRLSKPIVTRAMLRLADQAVLDEANRAMPKINLHPKLPALSARHACAPQIYPDCL